MFKKWFLDGEAMDANLNNCSNSWYFNVVHKTSNVDEITKATEEHPFSVILFFQIHTIA